MALTLVSRGGDVYLGFNETSIVLRFDGTTGARIRSYDMIALGCSSIIDVHGSFLYMAPADFSSRKALELDADTGKTLQTILSPTDMEYPVIVR